MPRSSLAVLGATGLMALAALGCSDTSEPSSTTSAGDRLRPGTSDISPTLIPQVSGTTNRLQAVSPVNTRVVWASGTGGTFVRTTNGGRTWQPGVVEGAEELEFRDVHGVSAQVAYLMSAGPGAESRIYKTEDGGQSWELQFLNAIPTAFYDCFDFWTPDRGITFSDAVDGRFPVIRTTDGETWHDIGDQLPPALPGEAAFAASGTCVTTHGLQHAWIATAAAERARVLATTDGGDTWEAYDTPIIQGTASSGGASVDFRDELHGILGGGELAAPTELSDNVARSSDGGKTWELTTPTPFPGAVYGLSYVRDGRPGAVVATGPSGAAWSPDEGDTWHLLPDVENYWAVAFAGPNAGWLVGTEGRILRIRFGQGPQR